MASIYTVHEQQRTKMFRIRVLILDFDFFTTIGGGQVFYRRVVERNPEMDFFFPSRGPDLIEKRRGLLPKNAYPFAFETSDAKSGIFISDPRDHWLRGHYIRLVCSVATAVQGRHFDVIDVPSFLPAADLVRPIFTSYGVVVEKIALSFLGWMSVSSRNAYESEADPDTAVAVEAAEIRSTNTADIRYTISDIKLHQEWQTTLPINLVDMHDTIESFPEPDPEPAGNGKPDIWYVGRLDGAKGPDIFIDIVSKIPAALYGQCLLTGPDNGSAMGTRWSDHVLSLARARGVEAAYVGRLSDKDVRKRVFGGNSVVVIPSRTDTFNYVALEATLSGCPVLLSERAGASAFLRSHHPDICPPIMDPDDVAAAASQLRDILDDYPAHARALRNRLRANPFPKPKVGFMADIYGAPSVVATEDRGAANADAEKMVDQQLLIAPLGQAWRPTRPARDPRVSIVVPVSGHPERLASTLAQLTRQVFELLEIVVVDDGSAHAEIIRSTATSFGPTIRFIRKSREGEAAAINRGIEEARGEFVGTLAEGDGYRPELIDESIEILDRHPEAIGTYVDWNLVDSAGFLVKTHRLPAFDRRLMLRAHRCLAGPGSLLRRSVLRETGGYDTSFTWLGDFDLWLRATAFGDMLHVPRMLAYRRMTAAQADVSDRREEKAKEHIRLIEQFLADSNEGWDRSEDRATALAAAHLAAAAALGAEYTGQAKTHLAEAHRLAPELISRLPADVSAYSGRWPE